MKEEFLRQQQQQQQQQHQQQQQQQQHQFNKSVDNNNYSDSMSSQVSPSVEHRGGNSGGVDENDAVESVNEKEEIFMLKCKLNEYEKQNSLLKLDTDRLNRRCAQLSMAEMQTTHELSNLKQKIQQMLDQYADLDRKFSENLNKLRQYEQR
jgi:hypothetical protein